MLSLYHVVLVVCTIATAKVPLGFAASLVEERNYNCYNVYFNECIPSKQTTYIKCPPPVMEAGIFAKNGRYPPTQNGDIRSLFWRVHPNGAAKLV